MHISVIANESTKIDHFVEAITAIAANTTMKFVHGQVEFEGGDD